VRYFICPEKSGLFVKRLQVKLDKDFPQEKRSDLSSKPTNRLPSFEEKKVVAEPIPAAAKTSIEEAVAAPAPIVAAPVVSSADPVIPPVPSPPSTLETQKALVKANLKSALEENATWSVNSPRSSIRVHTLVGRSSPLPGSEDGKITWHIMIF
jgi:hypothetical protein